MKINCAEFTKMTLQEIADMLLDQEKHTACCKGLVDDERYNLIIKLERVHDGD